MYILVVNVVQKLQVQDKIGQMDRHVFQGG